MNINNILPTKGRKYGSGEAITEIYEIINKTFVCEQERCDCDSGTRCVQCRIESQLEYIKTKLKINIQEFIDKLEENENGI